MVVFFQRYVYFRVHYAACLLGRRSPGLLTDGAYVGARTAQVTIDICFGVDNRAVSDPATATGNSSPLA